LCVTDLARDASVSFAEPALRLSKRTEYGLRAVVQLARLWPRGYVQSRDLAQQ
jgi:hypothetical protein